MSFLIEEERKVVAQRAMTYPLGFGSQWLGIFTRHNKFVNDAMSDTDAVAVAVANNKRLARVGCPAVKLMVMRGESTGDALKQAIDDICETLGISCTTYCDVLNKYPKLLGNILRRGYGGQAAANLVIKGLLSKLK